VLRSLPLDDAALADPVLALQLNDVRGRAVMAEIVKCALSPVQVLTFEDVMGRRFKWQGELGLCRHPENEVGDWSAAAPTQACQELVTGCLMARVNAKEMSVPISLQGKPVELFPSRPSVGAEPNLRERQGVEDPTDGTPIESFDPACAPGHECRWRPSYVGKCTTGEVTLAVDSAQCSTTMVRVCGGLHGCYGASSPVGFPSPVDYSKLIKQQSNVCAATPIRFDCPTDVAIGGTYSVMTRPTVLAGPPPLNGMSPPVIKVAGSGTFPATEATVFAYGEGAFYGNLFAGDDLGMTCAVSAATPTTLVCTRTTGEPEPVPCLPGTPGGCPPQPTNVAYRNVYACYSLTSGAGPDEEATAVAYLNDRICAQRTPGEHCFPHPPGRCAARCRWDAPSRSWQECQGRPDLAGQVPIYRPVSTRLNGPCDLIGGKVLCDLLRQKLH
jgi:hypothetical protein